MTGGTLDVSASTTPAGLTADQDKPQGPPCLARPPYDSRAAVANEAARKSARCASFFPRARVRAAEAGTGSVAAPPAQCVKSTLTVLPPAEREEQLRRHGLDPSPRWSGIEGAYVDLEPEDADFLQSHGNPWKAGYTIVDPEHDGRNSGMVAHRGVLHPDEHVDYERLVGLVEGELGFSFDELRSVYSTGGRIADHLRVLRGRVDARLLALSRAGSNMDLFSRVTGVNPRTVDRALSRARAAEVTT